MDPLLQPLTAVADRMAQDLDWSRQTRSAVHYCSWCKSWFSAEWVKLPLVTQKPWSHGICVDCLKAQKEKKDAK